VADRTGIFAGDDPFEIARAWMKEAEASELNDPNAMAMASVDETGLPNVRMVLLKEIEDAYYKSRSLKSRLGAWASKQSQPLSSRASLLAEVAKITASKGTNPDRPPFWGGFRIDPVEIEFWADGEFRLHNRFRWTKNEQNWSIQRLNP